MTLNRCGLLAATLAVLFMLVVHLPAKAEPWGWPTMPNLNPFSSGSPRRAPARSYHQEPTMLQRMGNGTKTILNNTKTALTPWNWQSNQGRATQRRSQSNGSWFSWWHEEEQQRPATVADWIGQSRPE